MVKPWRHRRDIQVLPLDGNLFRKWAAEPTFMSRKLIGRTEKLVIAEKRVRKVKLFKPIYTGMAVLELSKLHM